MSATEIPSLLAERARLLSLVLHRGSEWLDVARLQRGAAKHREPGVVELAERALGGDAQAWRACLVLAFLRQYPCLAPVMSDWKSESAVEVRALSRGEEGGA